MQTAPQYTSDVLFFFDGKPEELALYEALFQRLEALLPDAAVKVQKSQISFYGRHLFAAVSLRRRREWPPHCILVTFGLGAQKASPRIAMAVEAAPNRWTHHVPVSQPSELDGELLDWLLEAYRFSEAKGRRGRS